MESDGKDVGDEGISLGRTGTGKGGSYWTPVYGVTPEGRRKPVETFTLNGLMVCGRWCIVQTNTTP